MQGKLFDAPADMSTGIARKPGINHHGQVLWHFEADNTEDALKASGLDWEVVKQPIYNLRYAPGRNPVYDSIRDRSAIIQHGGKHDRTFHGIVSSRRYTPIQNKEIATVVDPLLSGGNFNIVQGGYTRKNRCWLIAESRRRDDITGKDDLVQGRLLIHWKHDGTAGVRADFIANRVACSNAIQALTREAQHAGDRTLLSINHTQNYQHTMNIVADVLRAQSEFTDKLVESLKAMAKTQLLHPNSLFTALAPAPAAEGLSERGYVTAVNRRNRLLDEMTRRYHEGLGVDVRPAGTVWAAYCAATEAVDHYLVHRTRSDSVEYAWFGDGRDLRIAAYDAAMNLVAAA
jgi:phage/plasmid-like protein (TIGR03299 family)